MARNISAPVGLSQVSAADDYGRAQALIANQIQKVWINDRACRSAIAIGSVATRTVGLVSRGAARSIASLKSLRRDIAIDGRGWTARGRCFLDAVAGKLYTLEVIRLGPA